MSNNKYILKYDHSATLLDGTEYDTGNNMIVPENGIETINAATSTGTSATPNLFDISASASSASAYSYYNAANHTITVPDKTDASRSVADYWSILAYDVYYLKALNNSELLKITFNITGDTSITDPEQTSYSTSWNNYACIFSQTSSSPGNAIVLDRSGNYGIVSNWGSGPVAVFSKTKYESKVDTTLYLSMSAKETALYSSDFEKLCANPNPNAGDGSMAFGLGASASVLFIKPTNGTKGASFSTFGAVLKEVSIYYSINGDIIVPYEPGHVATKDTTKEFYRKLVDKTLTVGDATFSSAFHYSLMSDNCLEDTSSTRAIRVPVSGKAVENGSYYSKDSELYLTTCLSKYGTKFSATYIPNGPFTYDGMFYDKKNKTLYGMTAAQSISVNAISLVKDKTSYNGSMYFYRGGHSLFRIAFNIYGYSGSSSLNPFSASSDKTSVKYWILSPAMPTGPSVGITSDGYYCIATSVSSSDIVKTTKKLVFGRQECLYLYSESETGIGILYDGNLKELARCTYEMSNSSGLFTAWMSPSNTSGYTWAGSGYFLFNTGSSSSTDDTPLEFKITSADVWFDPPEEPYSYYGETNEYSTVQKGIIVGSDKTVSDFNSGYGKTISASSKSISVYSAGEETFSISKNQNDSTYSGKPNKLLNAYINSPSINDAYINSSTFGYIYQSKTSKDASAFLDVRHTYSLFGFDSEVTAELQSDKHTASITSKTNKMNWTFEGDSKSFSESKASTVGGSILYEINGTDYRTSTINPIMTMRFESENIEYEMQLDGDTITSTDAIYLGNDTDIAVDKTPIKELVTEDEKITTTTRKTIDFTDFTGGSLLNATDPIIISMLCNITTSKFVSNNNWYSCSTILGSNLTGKQKDWGLVITSDGYFGLPADDGDYVTKTNVKVPINSLFRVILYIDRYNYGEIKLYFQDGGNNNGLITTAPIGVVKNPFSSSGTQPSAIGVFWNNSSTTTAIEGTITNLTIYKTYSKPDWRVPLLKLYSGSSHNYLCVDYDILAHKLFDSTNTTASTNRVTLSYLSGDLAKTNYKFSISWDAYTGCRIYDKNGGMHEATISEAVSPVQESDDYRKVEFFYVSNAFDSTKYATCKIKRISAALICSGPDSSSTETDMTAMKTSFDNKYLKTSDVTADTNTTYTLSVEGQTLTLTGSDGKTSEVTIPSSGSSGGSGTDTNTTYTLSIDGNNLTLTDSDKKVQTVLLPSATDTNTTYTLSVEGQTLTLTGSDGKTSEVTLPASGTASSNTTYSISKTGNTLTLTGSDGTSSNVSLPADTNTTYTMSLAGQKLSLTDSNKKVQTVTLPSGGSSSGAGSYTITGKLDNNDYIVSLNENDQTKDTVQSINLNDFCVVTVAGTSGSESVAGILNLPTVSLPLSYKGLRAYSLDENGNSVENEDYTNWAAAYNAAQPAYAINKTILKNDFVNILENGEVSASSGYAKNILNKDFTVGKGTKYTFKAAINSDEYIKPGNNGLLVEYKLSNLSNYTYENGTDSSSQKYQALFYSDSLVIYLNYGAGITEDDTQYMANQEIPSNTISIFCTGGNKTLTTHGDESDSFSYPETISNYDLSYNRNIAYTYDDEGNESRSAIEYWPVHYTPSASESSIYNEHMTASTLKTYHTSGPHIYSTKYKSTDAGCIYLLFAGCESMDVPKHSLTDGQFPTDSEILSSPTNNMVYILDDTFSILCAARYGKSIASETDSDELSSIQVPSITSFYCGTIGIDDDIDSFASVVGIYRVGTNDKDTSYDLSLKESILNLNGSDGSKSSVQLPSSSGSSGTVMTLITDGTSTSSTIDLKNEFSMLRCFANREYSTKSSGLSTSTGLGDEVFGGLYTTSNNTVYVSLNHVDSLYTSLATGTQSGDGLVTLDDDRTTISTAAVKYSSEERKHYYAAVFTASGNTANAGPFMYGSSIVSFVNDPNVSNDLTFVSPAVQPNGVYGFVYRLTTNDLSTIMNSGNPTVFFLINYKFGLFVSASYNSDGDKLILNAINPYKNETNNGHVVQEFVIGKLCDFPASLDDGNYLVIFVNPYNSNGNIECNVWAGFGKNMDSILSNIYTPTNVAITESSTFTSFNGFLCCCGTYDSSNQVPTVKYITDYTSGVCFEDVLYFHKEDFKYLPKPDGVTSDSGYDSGLTYAFT